MPALYALGPEDAALVVDFVRVSGSLKALGRLRKMSYPTVRARLNAVIERLAYGAPRELWRIQRQSEVLGRVARGEIGAAEADARLSELAEDDPEPWE